MNARRGALAVPQLRVVVAPLVAGTEGTESTREHRQRDAEVRCRTVLLFWRWVPDAYLLVAWGSHDVQSKGQNPGYQIGPSIHGVGLGHGLGSFGLRSRLFAIFL